ncbi:hypothetical protein ACLOAV_010241 [Pseudogymnoascus australis]
MSSPSIPTPTSSSSSSIYSPNPAPPLTTTMTPASVALRPKFGTRKSSGTMIVLRDAPNIELKEGEEAFHEGDARAMSPRRNSDVLEKMSQEARAQLSQSVRADFPPGHVPLVQAQHAATSRFHISNRLVAIKEEHDKLDNNNKSLQKYINDVMSTLEITVTGPASQIIASSDPHKEDTVSGDLRSPEDYEPVEDLI